MTLSAENKLQDLLLRLIVGPRSQVPSHSKYTLEEIQRVRLRQITPHEFNQAVLAAKAIESELKTYLLSDDVAGRLAVELQASNRFMTIDSARAMVDAVIKEANVGTEEPPPDKFYGEITDEVRLNWLETQTRKSQTGISFDCVPAVDGDQSGFRFMRRHFIGTPAKTLREAIDRQIKAGQDN